jgi:geranylgeranyl diphosphate synthase, type II
MEDVLPYFNESKSYVETKLKEYMGSTEPLLKVLEESINYSLYSGGKRIRPLFALVVGDLFGVSRNKLASLACALEMIHTASLIMDDLPNMDDAKTRRGRPANHVIYGQDVATLASIGLLTRAYEIVLADNELPPDRKTRVVGKLANLVGTEGLVGGQFVDLKCSGPEMDSSTLEYIHHHKTAILFVASGSTAAIIGNASDEEIAAIEEYGRNLGFAFQILDDLLDSAGSTEKVGKPLHRDRGNFAMLYGRDKCRQLVQDHTNAAIKAIELFGGRNQKLIALGRMLLKRKS